MTSPSPLLTGSEIQEPAQEGESESMRMYTFLDWFDHDNDTVEASTSDTIAEIIKE